MFNWLIQKLSRATPTPENPRFNINSAEAWETFVGGEKSTTGVAVNYESALTYSPWWRGINLISRDVAKLPLMVYRRNGEGKDRDTEHAAYRLLRYKPNREMTAFVFRQTLQAHALNEGNGYAFIFRDGAGLPVELIPLPPDSVTPVRANGKLWYVLSVNGEQSRVDPTDILHIKGLGFDGLCGYSLWQKAKNSIGLGMASEEFGARYYSNGAEPRAVIEHPSKLSDKAAANLRASWNAMHQGLKNSHKVAILEEGMKLNGFSSNAKDAMLLETRQYQIRDVANWLGIPPHKLGDTTRTAFASLEQENQSYLDDALDPWLVNWEEECREKLLSEEEKTRDTHVIEFVRNALVRADLTARANYYRVALGGRAWMTQNEVRGRENLNPADGGDVILEPLNMTNPGGNPDTTKQAAPDPTVAEAVRKTFIDAVHRMLRRLAIPRTKTDVATLRKDHGDIVFENIFPAARALASLHGRQVNEESIVDAIFDFPPGANEGEWAESLAKKVITGA